MVKKLAVGIFLEKGNDVREGLEYSRSIGYDYICADVVEPEVTQKLLQDVEAPLDDPFTFSDLTLQSTDWSHSFVGKISNLRSELASEDRVLRRNAVQLIKHEIDYCMHLNAPAILVEPDPKCVGNMAELVNAKTAEYMNSIWIRIPMLVEADDFVRLPWHINECNSDIEEAGRSGWYMWSNFHGECNYERRVGVCLEMSVDVPCEEDIKRWLGEPIKSVIIPTAVFVQNSKGFPVLSKMHQQLLKRLFNVTSQVVIQPNGPLKEEHKLYRQYVDHLHLQWIENNQEDSWLVGYDDYLQSPLQPLMNNLESHTYEVFEKDPIKYVLYERAIGAALLDKQPEPKEEKLVVMVLGAGRGPIVKAAILASQKTDRPINLFALEKNRHAANTLLHLKRTVWKEMGFDVTVVHQDMRKWKAPVKADVIVSELLGSFGDNELSPECLDGAQSYLKDDGIMIPQNYTSFVHPIMSAKLHTEVRTLTDKNPKTDAAHYQTPYVVHMKNKYDISEPVKLFEFHHPNRISNDTNDRSKQVDFVANSDCVLSGFAGYFESELFGGVMMSILPSSITEGMLSWFPIYFPIKNPVQIRKGETISARFRRCSSGRSVWYEWNVVSPVIIPTHNLNGSAYEIGL